MNPMVSIIIPVYNAERYLKTTLESVINQCFHNFEVIAVNDGSKDSSLDILKTYATKDSRIHIIDKENTGVSDTRNKGIENALGKYLSFVDADDLVSPYYLEKLVTIAEKESADMVVCNYKPFHREEECFAEQETKLNYRLLESSDELLQTGRMTSACTKLVRREIIEKYSIRFRYGMTFGEDLFFCWKAYEAGKRIFITDEVLYGYRMGAEGASGRFHANLYEVYKDSFRELKDFCKKYRLLNKKNSLEMDIYFVKRLPAFSLMSARERTSTIRKRKCMEKILQDDIFKDILNNYWDTLIYGETEMQCRLYYSAKTKNINNVLQYGKRMDFRIKLSRLKTKLMNLRGFSNDRK